MRSPISTTTLAALGGMLLATFGISVVAFGDAGVDPTRLPLGDGKVTTSGAKKGYVYVCHTSNAPAGAFRDGPWIKSDGTFDLTSKAVVDGSVAWPGRVTFAKSGSALRVSGNGLPVTGTTTGVFPIASSDDAYQYDRNPNSIGASTVSYTLPASPKLASRPTYSIPSCLTDGEATNKPSGLVGYALDGIPIYGRRGEGGKLVSNDDLDACHGRTSWVSLNGKRVRIYHYQATLEYPYTLGCYRGTAASAVGGGPR
jgi:hypothetical protein